MDEEQALREILTGAAADAVRLLANTMRDEETDAKLRVDIAKELLSRAYGKGPMAAPEEAKSVAFILEGDLERFSR